MAFPTISVVHEGDKVFAVVDALGIYSKMAQETMLARVVQPGVLPIDTAAVASELQQTWNREDVLARGEGYTKLSWPGSC